MAGARGAATRGATARGATALVAGLAAGAARAAGAALRCLSCAEASVDGPIVKLATTTAVMNAMPERAIERAMGVAPTSPDATTLQTFVWFARVGGARSGENHSIHPPFSHAMSLSCFRCVATVACAHLRAPRPLWARSRLYRIAKAAVCTTSGRKRDAGEANLLDVAVITARYPPRQDVDLDALADMATTVVEGGMILGRVFRDMSILPRQIMLYRDLVRAIFLPPG